MTFPEATKVRLSNSLKMEYGGRKIEKMIVRPLIDNLRLKRENYKSLDSGTLRFSQKFLFLKL